MKYLLLLIAFPVMAQDQYVLSPETVARCKAGGGCVMMLESDFKAALEKAASRVPSCLKESKWKT